MADRRRHDLGRKESSRSRSPVREHRHSHRDRSPGGPSHRRHKSTKTAPTGIPEELPYKSRQLTKQDFQVFRPLLGLYLDVQKNRDLDAMDETEAKGRWKSFMGKWNRGELANGWYDPETLQNAVISEQEYLKSSRDEGQRHREPVRREPERTREVFTKEDVQSDGESDDSVGPALPGSKKRNKRAGPSIPNLDDLKIKREMEIDGVEARREDLCYERKVDRKEQKEALDELVPRADAGTRERQLEKKKEVNEKMKSFREKSPGATDVPDSELMGGGDTTAELKRMKQEFERKKNERELRKEEFLRARAAEREERMAEYQQKEDKTMAMLKALAKQNFG